VTVGKEVGILWSWHNRGTILRFPWSIGGLHNLRCDLRN